MEFAFNINLRTFAEDFLGYFGQRAPADDIVPFGLFDALTITVFVVLGSSERERCLFNNRGRIVATVVLRERNHIWISTNITN